MYLKIFRKLELLLQKILWKMEHLLQKISWKMEHLLFWSKYSIFHILKSIKNSTLIFLEFFSMFSKNRKWCHDLKIAYGVKGKGFLYRKARCIFFIKSLLLNSKLKELHTFLCTLIEGLMLSKYLEICLYIFLLLTMTYKCIARRRQRSLGFNIIWASTQETQNFLLANNKGSDQPVHPCRLISFFVIHYLESKVIRSDIS